MGCAYLRLLMRSCSSRTISQFKVKMAELIALMICTCRACASQEMVAKAEAAPFLAIRFRDGLSP